MHIVSFTIVQLFIIFILQFHEISIFFQVRNNKKTAVLAMRTDSKKKGTETSSKKKLQMYIVYRPNTGQQVKLESLSELKKKYKKVQADEAEPHWNHQFTSSLTKCSHAYW